MIRQVAIRPTLRQVAIRPTLHIAAAATPRARLAIAAVAAFINTAIQHAAPIHQIIVMNLCP